MYSEKNMFILMLIGSLALITVTAGLIYAMTMLWRKRYASDFKGQQKIIDYLQSCVDEDERQFHRIGRSVHNYFLQNLFLIRHHVKLLEAKLPDEEHPEIAAIGAAAREMKAHVEHLLRDVNREFIRNTNLPHLLEGELKLIGKEHELEYEFKQEGQMGGMKEQDKELIFRIAQEAIQNAVSHAAAKRISVNLRHREHHFQMIINDNGMGFGAEKLKVEEGWGLKQMRQRARCLQGQLSIDSTPMKGTTVSLLVNNLSC